MNSNSLVYQLKLILENASIKKELDELKRVVQYLNREENISITLQQLIELFKNSKETKITPKIWRDLENTESNQIKKGDMDKVIRIAKKYGKTNPKKLSDELLSNTYDRPLIIQFGNRYHLVAGNTRLSTAAALGITPYVIIAQLPTTLEEFNTTAAVPGYLTPKAFTATPPRKTDTKKKKSNLDKSVGKYVKRSFVNTIPLSEMVKKVLNELDLAEIEPFDIKNYKIKKSISGAVISSESKIDENINILNIIEIKEPSEYYEERMATATLIMYINGKVDIDSKNKNVLGVKGLLKFYRTSFGFLKDNLEKIEKICEEDYSADGIIYKIHGADSNEQKAAQKSRVYKNLLNFIFDSDYEIYEKNGEFEIVKYFDNE